MKNIFKRKLKITEHENGAIVFDKTKGIYFQTNEVGLCIIRLLSLGENSEKIKKEISKKFDIGIEQASIDVDEFLSLLAEMGLK